MPTSLASLAASFSRHLRAEGKSERTGVLYGQSVRFFSEWLEAQGMQPTVDELTPRNIRTWLAELAETKSVGTCRTRYKGLHRFCGWLVSEEEIADHPMRGLSAPVAEAPPVPVLTDDELARLLKACSGKEFRDRRDEAFIRVLLDCGVRVSEACELTVAGLDLDDGVALVKGKGSRIRAIYPSARTIRALDRYLRIRATQRWAHLDALFITQRGALSPDGARDRISLRGEQAGIKGLHPHQFRHSWAHDFLVSGGQERDLKRLAGWRSDVMLERYGASAADARARAAAQRMKRGDRV